MVQFLLRPLRPVQYPDYQHCLTLQHRALYTVLACKTCSFYFTALGRLGQCTPVHNQLCTRTRLGVRSTAVEPFVMETGLLWQKPVART